MKTIKYGFMLLLLTGMFFMQATAVNAAVTFGVSADRTKVGDFPVYYPTWGQAGLEAWTDPVSGATYLFAAYIGQFPIPGSYYRTVYVSMSKDGGKTWEGTTRAVYGTSIADYDVGLTVIPDPIDMTQPQVHVVWAQTDGAVYYSKSSGDLSNWSSPVSVSGPIVADGYDHTIGADNSGNVHVTFRGQNSQYYYAVSDDNGTSFAAPVAIGTTTGPAATGFAVDKATGTAYFTWIDVNDGCLYAAKRDPVSGSWAARTTVSTTPYHNANGLGIAVFNETTVYIAFADDQAWEIQVAATADSGTNWAVNGGPILDDFNGGYSLAVDPSGVLNLAFARSTGIYFDRSTNGGQRWMQSPVTVITGSGMLSSFPTIVVDNQGKAGIMFGAPGTGVYFSKEN